MDVDGYTLWINGGSLLFVAPQVEGAERQAVLDSHLYAQLLANKRAGSRFTEHKAWYRAYRTALTDRGWLLTQQHQTVETVSALAPIAPVQPLQADRVPRSGVTEPTEGALLAREVGHRGSWLTLSLRRPNTHQRNHDDQAHYRIDRVG